MDEAWWEKFRRLRESRVDVVTGQPLGITGAARLLMAHYPYYEEHQLDTAVATIKRWEKGRVAEPGEDFKKAIAAMFGLPYHDYWANDRPDRNQAVPSALAPDEFADLMDRFSGSLVGQSSLDQAEAQVERLCSEYASRPAPELAAEVNQWIGHLNELKLGAVLSLTGVKQTYKMVGTLALLRSCLMWDQRLEVEATQARVSAATIARELGDGPLEAWTWEIQAWMALTRGDMPRVVALTTAGMECAPHAPVSAQLAAQQAKAWSRMGDRRQTEISLDHIRRILNANGQPTNIRNHFTVDPAKASFYIMDAYRVLGEDTQADAMAETVIRSSLTPMGEVLSPMRLAEAQLTRAVVRARAGDVSGAIALAESALNHGRRSVPSLLLVAHEVAREIERVEPKSAYEFHTRLESLRS